MSRKIWTTTMLCLAMLAATAGCRIPHNPYDDTYPARSGGMSSASQFSSSTYGEPTIDQGSSTRSEYADEYLADQ